MDSWASLPTNEHDLGCHEKITWALLDFSSSQAGFACMCHPTRRAFLFCARTFNDIQFFSHDCFALFVLLVMASLAIPYFMRFWWRVVGEYWLACVRWWRVLLADGYIYSWGYCLYLFRTPLMRHWHHCAYNVYQHLVYLGCIDNALSLQQRSFTRSQWYLLHGICPTASWIRGQATPLTS